MTASGKNKPWPQQILFFSICKFWGHFSLCVNCSYTYAPLQPPHPLILFGLVNYSEWAIKVEMVLCQFACVEDWRWNRPFFKYITEIICDIKLIAQRICTEAQSSQEDRNMFVHYRPRHTHNKCPRAYSVTLQMATVKVLTLHRAAINSTKGFSALLCHQAIYLFHNHICVYEP